MRKTTLILLLLFAVSCKTTRQSYIGNYTEKGKDYTYILDLRKDSTFTFTKKYFEVNNQCEGKWKFVAKDSIQLLCNDEELFSQIASGYMNEREQIVKVINFKKMKVGKTLLKKSN